MLTPALAATVFLGVGHPAQAIEAPFRIGDHAIIVDAVVNGKPASFMFDSGYAGFLVVSDQVKIGPPAGVQGLRDFVGSFEATTVRVDSFQIGALKRTNLNEEAVQMPAVHYAYTLSYGTHCDGIMGFRAVKDYVTEINFQNQKFVFHPNSFDITKKLPNNTTTFLVKMEPRGMNSIHLPTEINGHPVHLALDTGNAFYATTHKEVLQRIGLWNPNEKPKYMSQAFVASGPVDSFSFWVNNATIFTVPVKSAIFDIIDLPSSSADDDGTVGFGFLKHFNIIIDYERRYVWLENWDGKVFDEPDAGPGFRLGFIDSERTRIFHVYPSGPADLAGIKAGDRLVQVEGKSTSLLKPEEIEKLLRGPEGSTCKIVVSSNGVLKRLELVRKLMVNGTRAP